MKKLPPLSRRTLLKGGAAAALAVAGLGDNLLRAATDDKRFPPTRRITRGPKHHWFGYYDKLQFDPTSRYVLGMEVDFEHRSPTGDDGIKIGMVDLADGDRWIELGESRAWCWQQGCMLQWLPGSKSTILWNDRQGDRFVCRLLDVHSRAMRTIPHPVYSISPDGKAAVAPDFRRIQDVRPGYGYADLPDPFEDDLAPGDSGIFHIDLATGESKLIISLADIARLGVIPKPQPGIKHYFNHLLFSPDGSRFIALHRWRYPDGSRLTRMITARPDGGDVRVVIPNGYASHFIWRDPGHILSQAKGWRGNDDWGDFLFEDKDGGGLVEEIGHGVLDPSGHLTYLPGGDWILNDTYPQGAERLQTPHLYHVKSGRRIDLGHFHLPKIYRGEWRVDTHPRYSPDSRYVCIDAPVEGEGRQLHLIDICDIVSA
ncbi:MAG: twin-arginine translocation signal domain-containing protein [Pirellulaceae bacterium]